MSDPQGLRSRAARVNRSNTAEYAELAVVGPLLVPGRRDAVMRACERASSMHFIRRAGGVWAQLSTGDVVTLSTPRANNVNTIYKPVGDAERFAAMIYLCGKRQVHVGVCLH